MAVVDEPTGFHIVPQSEYRGQPTFFQKLRERCSVQDKNRVWYDEKRFLAKPQRFCIYCGGAGLTKEHIWGNWLKNHIPRDMPHYSQYSAWVHPTHTDAVQKKHPGDIHSRKPRIVCELCNTGWMSRLQETTKPILLPLIGGKKTELTPRDQRCLAAWCCMVAMNAEYVNTDRVAIQQKDRDCLHLTGVAPNNWTIRIANYIRGVWPGHMVHNVFRIDSEDRPKVNVKGLPIPNTQTTTFVVGRLYVHCFSSIRPALAHRNPPHAPGSTKLQQIWPARSYAIIWPQPALTDIQADKIANEFFAKAKSGRYGR